MPNLFPDVPDTTEAQNGARGQTHNGYLTMLINLFTSIAYPIFFYALHNPEDKD